MGPARCDMLTQLGKPLRQHASAFAVGPRFVGAPPSYHDDARRLGSKYPLVAIPPFTTRNCGLYSGILATERQKGIRCVSSLLLVPREEISATPHIQHCRLSESTRYPITTFQALFPYCLPFCKRSFISSASRYANLALSTYLILHVTSWSIIEAAHVSSVL